MARPKGGYYNAAGVRLPGVTTIIGRFKESGGLIHWAAKTAYQQGVDRKPLDIYAESAAAADVGTLAHAMVEARLKGLKEVQTTVDDPQLIEMARQAFAMFEHWWSETSLEITHTEVDVKSEEYQYGGCIDALGVNSKGRCLLDWKATGKIYADGLIQMAAYGRAWDETHPDDPIIGGYYIVRFAKDNADFAHRYYQDLTDAWEQFKLFRAAYDIDKALKKRVG